MKIPESKIDPANRHITAFVDSIQTVKTKMKMKSYQKNQIRYSSIQYWIFSIQYSIFPFLSLLRYSIFNIRYSIFFFLLLSLLLFPPSLPAQEWTEPVNISNLGGYSKSPDMVLDNKGTIHIVWVYKIITSYALILYSYSEDNGLTWAEPFDLLQNNDYLMEQPHIALDSKNNLYVTYTHDYLGWTTTGRVIKMVYYDGYQWSEPFVISEGMPGSHYPKILIDNEDNLHVLWGYLSDKMYYRYRKNTQWSDIYCPYCDSTDWFYFSDGIQIVNSTMHLSGSSLSQNYYGERPQYYIYNIENNSWQNPEMISNDTMVVDIDISINRSDVPETAYRKKSNLTPGVVSDSTMNTNKSGISWQFPELVSGVNGTQEYQQIEVDQQNNVHVVEVQERNDGYGLFHFEKSGDNWKGRMVDSCYIVNFPKLILNSNRLYLVYSKTWEANKEFVADLFFTKYDIITGQNQPTSVYQDIRGINVYPNPGVDKIIIEFENKHLEYIRISIFNIIGQHIKTVTNKTFPPGRQRLIWNGTDKNGKEVKSGPYFIHLKSGRKSVSKIMEIIK